MKGMCICGGEREEPSAGVRQRAPIISAAGGLCGEWLLPLAEYFEIVLYV